MRIWFKTAGATAPTAPVPVFYTRERQKGSPGNDLLSQGPTSQVPSALEGLTAWFGMEQGVSPPLEPPEEPSMLLSCAMKRHGGARHYVFIAVWSGTLKTEQDAWQERQFTLDELSPRPLVRLS